MAFAKGCICGHNITDHKVPSKVKPQRECLWFGCPCLDYAFGKMINQSYSPAEFPTLIDAAHDYRNMNRPKRRTILNLDDCDRTGVHQEYQRRESSYNGEYC